MNPCVYFMTSGDNELHNWPLRYPAASTPDPSPPTQPHLPHPLPSPDAHRPLKQPTIPLTAPCKPALSHMHTPYELLFIQSLTR
ncbi:hypothetical protein E2C01_092438 [Portunus trituberculatus]|uniref:Uncharacterized protein n=1 Tax=Portunus trituberculatus TaxID=210409 RepID=A0A5B7JXS6_PORTR|nr:hypothetical protein [Portunus trituberculatus]